MQISNMMSAFFVEEKQGSHPVFDRIGSRGAGTMTGGSWSSAGAGEQSGGREGKIKRKIEK